MMVRFLSNKVQFVADLTAERNVSEAANPETARPWAGNAGVSSAAGGNAAGGNAGTGNVGTGKLSWNHPGIRGVPTLPAHLARVLTICAFASGCSLGSGAEIPEMQRSGGFEVKVKANGHEVKNFEQDLIHRITLSREVLAELQHYSRVEEIAIPGKDGRGTFQGLKVRKAVPPNILQNLGLQSGDVVTAFGIRNVQSDMSFMEFLLSLDALDDSSLTFIRKGQAHKVLYQLVGAHSATGTNGSAASGPGLGTQEY